MRGGTNVDRHGGRLRLAGPLCGRVSESKLHRVAGPAAAWTETATRLVCASDNTRADAPARRATAQYRAESRPCPRAHAAPFAHYRYRRPSDAAVHCNAVQW